MLHNTSKNLILELSNYRVAFEKPKIHIVIHSECRGFDPTTSKLVGYDGVSVHLRLSS
jgi:hypothetical protein